EVELVQERGIERGELLALEGVDEVARGLLEIERFELLGDGVQAPHRPAVVVLVMALDEVDREVGERPGADADLLQRVAHKSSKAERERHVAPGRSGAFTWRRRSEE